MSAETITLVSRMIFCMANSPNLRIDVVKAHRRKPVLFCYGVTLKKCLFGIDAANALYQVGKRYFLLGAEIVRLCVVVADADVECLHKVLMCNL